ncbi:MAG: hypothetical protein ACYSUK_04495 [Planctomycetota bacterium]|jgi:hypothetical protein
MSKRRYLTEKQRTVLEDIFSGEHDEQRLKNKHHLQRGTLRRWLNNKLFCKEFERCLRAAQFRSAALLGKASHEAAMKLIKLKDKGSEETMRKACLDIIRLSRDVLKNSTHSIESVKREESTCELKHQIPPEKASSLLKVLAE